VVQREQREIVDPLAVDEVKDTPNEQFTSAVTMTFTILLTVNKRLLVKLL